MAIKNIQIRPKGDGSYSDVLHPETNAGQVKFADGTTVEAHKAEKASAGSTGHAQVDGVSIVADETGQISTKGVVVDGKKYIGVKVISEFKFPKESANLGGYILSFAQDEDYIYAPTDTVQKIFKVQKSDLSIVGELYTGNNIMYGCVSDEAYVYIGLGNTSKIWKIQKSDMTMVNELSVSPNLGATQDENYLYASVYDGGAHKIWKIQKSNLTKQAETGSLGSTIRCAEQDEGYVYVGLNDKKIYKLQKSDMGQVSVSGVLDDMPSAILEDGEYLYICIQNKLYKMLKSDMSVAAEYAISIDSFYCAKMFRDTSHIYVPSGQKILKIYKLDMSTKAETSVYGGTVRDILLDADYVYMGGGKRTILRLDNVEYLKIKEVV